MLRTIYLSFLCCTCLYFTACEKTAIEEMIAEEVVVEIQDLKQDIVFHQSLQNLETNMISGWMINGKGDLRTYEMPLTNYNMDRPIVKGDDLYALMAKAKNTGVQVDFTVLEAHFNNLKAIEKTALQAVEEKEEQILISTTIAYREINYSGVGSDTHGDDGECSDEPGAYTEEDYFEKLVLEEIGQRNRLNTSEVVQEMLTWLRQMEGNL